MATRRSNGEGTIWLAKSEGRYRAQYPDASGHRRKISGKTRRDVEKKLRIALTKRDSNILEEMSSIAGTTVADFNDAKFEYALRQGWDYSKMNSVVHPPEVGCSA